MTKRAAPEMEWRCETCGQSPVRGRVVYQRGYWWCLRCATTWTDADGEIVVGFPSAGKFIPRTIPMGDTALGPSTRADAPESPEKEEDKHET